MAKETPGLSGRNVAPESPVKQILSFLSSMQLGIILLLLLAVISVFATMREAETAIQGIYNSWWFIGIMAFTALNLLLCTVQRIQPLSKLALHPQKTATADSIRKMQVHRAVKAESEEAALATAKAAFGKIGLKVTEEAGTEGKVLFGERGKYGYFGSIVTHVSLLVILLGAMYGSLTGFEERNGGIAGSNFFVSQGNFRVDISAVRMVQEEDPTIRPKVFSDVVITRGGKELTKGTIAINQPLRFQGNTIYHSTFMYVSAVKIKDVETGEEMTDKYFDRDTVKLDSKGSTLHFMQFFPNFTMRQDGTPFSKNYLDEKPVLAGVLVKNGRGVRNVFLQVDKPEIVETDDGKVELTLLSYENAAVYSIAKNLGRPLLFWGACLMIVGLYMSFFLFPRRFWAVYDEKKGTLVVGGRGYRNRLGIEQDMERIESDILNREGV